MVLLVDFKYKKELKEAIKNKQDFSIEDPSWTNPHSFMASEMFEGQNVAITNHPKRSWYANLKMIDGKIKVTA